MQESTITVKGQTTLPRDIRQALNLRPGDRVRSLILDGGEVRIVRARPVADLSGALRDESRPTVTFDPKAAGPGMRHMEDAVGR